MARRIVYWINSCYIDISWLSGHQHISWYNWKNIPPDCLLCIDKGVTELVLKLKASICSLRLDTQLYSYRFKVSKHLHDSAEIFDLLSTWPISQSRTHTVVQFVGNLLNINIVWLYIREFILGIDLMCVLCVASHS